MPSPNVSWLKLCCNELSTSERRVRLFLAIINIIAAINSKIIIVKMAMMKAIKCCSGSWSIGFGEMTGTIKEIPKWNKLIIKSEKEKGNVLKEAHKWMCDRNGMVNKIKQWIAYSNDCRYWKRRHRRLSHFKSNNNNQ